MGQFSWKSVVHGEESILKAVIYLLIFCRDCPWRFISSGLAIWWQLQLSPDRFYLNSSSSSSGNNNNIMLMMKSVAPRRNVNIIYIVICSVLVVHTHALCSFSTKVLSVLADFGDKDSGWDTQCSSCCLFSSRLAFLLRQHLKPIDGMYSVNGKHIGSHSSVVLYSCPAYFPIPVLYLFRRPLEHILSSMLWW